MEDDLSDDYVAQLLAKDARDSSIKYSAMGMGAFLPSKTPLNKPKPNTRFLRNIVKEADSHNAALLAKEAIESKARLERLGVKEPRSTGDIRKRQLGMIAAHLTRPSSTDRGENDRSAKRRRRESLSNEDDIHQLASSNRSSKHRDSREPKDTHGNSRSSHRSRRTSAEKEHRHRRRRSRSRSHSPRINRPEESSRQRKSRHRHRANDSDEQGHIDGEMKRHSHHRNSKDSGRRQREPSPRKSEHDEAGHDSDPLADLIGPRAPSVPEVRYRGRGIASSASGIDQRFSKDYDASTDIALNFEEENDWDQALEALRDRQKWQNSQADRLRAAGFTEAEVNKWERGGEKQESDVKWAKKGEGREWDRGKAVDTELGEMTVRKRSPELDLTFGRLKDT